MMFQAKTTAMGLWKESTVTVTTASVNMDTGSMGMARGVVGAMVLLISLLIYINKDNIR